MNKPKLSDSKYGITIEFNHQDHCYVITDSKGKKNFIRDRNRALVMFKRYVLQFETAQKLGLRVV